jgi:sulfatase modifying factor 1
MLRARRLIAPARRATFVSLALSLLLNTGTPEAREKPLARRTDRLGLSLVLIPAGDFLMGTTDQQEDVFRTRFWRSAPPEPQDLQLEKPQHRVRLSKAFYLSAHEITIGQFRRFVTATGYLTDAEKAHRGGRGFSVRGGRDHDGQFASGPQYTWKNPGFPQSEAHPVVEVSWNDAVAFSAWLSREEKAVYRLPTEAEWEYACRSGSQTSLSFGDDPSIGPLYANLADGALERAHPGHVLRQSLLNVEKEPKDGFVYTAPVGRFRANHWGLFDMHGNVWEWCEDRFLGSYDRQLSAKTTTVDPPGPEGPGGSTRDAGPVLRILRGGSWYSNAVTARSSSRLWSDPADAYCYAGFRVVREP